VCLLLGVQVVFDLYARSAVTAATFDAARHVAGFDVASLPPADLAAAEADAEMEARNILGRYGASATFSWNVTDSDVALNVHVVNPSLLSAGLGRALGIDTIDRSVRIHAERLICPPAESACTAAATP